MTTLNTRAIQLLAQKINERLAQFNEEAFSSSEFTQFKEYCGKRDGLRLALDLCEEVEQEINA